MCGIAGFSLLPDSELEPTQLARLLLAGIADRGDDACGYAYELAGELVVHKSGGGASLLLPALIVPQGARSLILHVREHTKGSPSIAANNHPVCHGAIAGIHNGQVYNDDQLFAEHGLERAEPAMTVDSEAIFALLDAYPGQEQRVLQLIRGSLAAAWLDRRLPGRVRIARGARRPLALAHTGDGVFFASTRIALELVSRRSGLAPELADPAEGTLLELAGGEIVSQSRFTPDHSFEEPASIALASPQERERCLQLLHLAPAV